MLAIRRSGRLALALALVAGATACTRVGQPVTDPAPHGAAEPEPVALPDVSGAWTGYLSVEGQGLDGTLQIEQDGGELSVVFEAPDFGLRAEGAGSVSAEGEVAVTLEYDLQCPGTAELAGLRSDDGLVLDGSLSASDCTGSSAGSFSFRR